MRSSVDGKNVWLKTRFSTESCDGEARLRFALSRAGAGDSKLLTSRTDGLVVDGRNKSFNEGMDELREVDGMV